MDNLWLLVLREAQRVRVTLHERRDGKRVALQHRRGPRDPPHEVRQPDVGLRLQPRLSLQRSGVVHGLRPPGGVGDAVQRACGLVDRLDVHVHHCLPLDLVRVAHRLLEEVQRLLERQDARQAEERRLHHRVDALPKPSGVRDSRGVDRPELRTLAAELPLHPRRQGPVQLRVSPRAVQNEDPAGLHVPRHVVLLHVPRQVASHVVRLEYKVLRPDLLLPEPQVAHRESSRLVF